MAKSMMDVYIKYTKTKRFKNLAPATQKIYDRAIDKLRYINIDAPHARSYLIEILERYEDTPGIYNQCLSLAKLLANYAVECGYINTNPFNGIKKQPIGEIAAWNQAEINMAKMCLQGIPRRIFFLCLYTGQRFYDVVYMDREGLVEDDNGNYVSIKVHQHKTNTKVYVPICNALNKEMKTWKKNEHGNFHDPLNNAHSEFFVGIGKDIPLRMVMRRECERHNLPTYIHGLRKSAAIMLAESGCTDAQIMAITGHKTRAMVSHYTKEANQKLLAQAAIDKLNAKKP